MILVTVDTATTCMAVGNKAVGRMEDTRVSHDLQNLLTQRELACLSAQDVINQHGMSIALSDVAATARKMRL